MLQRPLHHSTYRQTHRFPSSHRQLHPLCPFVMHIPRIADQGQGHRCHELTEPALMQAPPYYGSLPPRMQGIITCKPKCRRRVAYTLACSNIPAAPHTLGKEPGAFFARPDECSLGLPHQIAYECPATTDHAPVTMLWDESAHGSHSADKSAHSRWCSRRLPKCVTTGYACSVINQSLRTSSNLQPLRHAKTWPYSFLNKAMHARSLAHGNAVRRHLHAHRHDCLPGWHNRNERGLDVDTPRLHGTATCSVSASHLCDIPDHLKQCAALFDQLKGECVCRAGHGRKWRRQAWPAAAHPCVGALGVDDDDGGVDVDTDGQRGRTLHGDVDHLSHHRARSHTLLGSLDTAPQFEQLQCWHARLCNPYTGYTVHALLL